MHDVAALVKRSRRFYRDHGLPDWSQAIPKAADLAPLDADDLTRAAKHGFDQGFAFPAFAVQMADLERLVDATIRKPAPALPDNQQYRGEPFLSDGWTRSANGKILQRRDDLGPRTEGAYLFLFSTRPATNTWGKTARQLAEMFQARGWQGLTVTEYFVLQRVLCEEYGDHRFLAEPQDDKPTHWLWLLDSMTDADCSVAMTNARGINVQACPINHRDARRAAVAGMVLPLWARLA